MTPAPPEEPAEFVEEHCPATTTTLSTEEALAVLEPYFLAAREVFETESGHDLGRVRLEIARWIHDSPRHFAATSEDGLQVIVAPEMAEMPEETVVAIMSHEFGHVLDMLRPAEYELVSDRLRHRALPNGDGDDKRERQERIARMKQWEKRDRDTVERVADAIAEHMTGHSIGYMGPCLLQSFEGGARRPEGLR